MWVRCEVRQEAARKQEMRHKKIQRRGARKYNEQLKYEKKNNWKYKEIIRKNNIKQNLIKGLQIREKHVKTVKTSQIPLSVRLERSGRFESLKSSSFKTSKTKGLFWKRSYCFHNKSRYFRVKAALSESKRIFQNKSFFQSKSSFFTIRAVM